MCFTCFKWIPPYTNLSPTNLTESLGYAQPAGPMRHPYKRAKKRAASAALFLPVSEQASFLVVALGAIVQWGRETILDHLIFFQVAKGRVQTAGPSTVTRTASQVVVASLMEPEGWPTV